MPIRRGTSADIAAMLELARASSGAADWSPQHYASLFPIDQQNSSPFLILVADHCNEAEGNIKSDAKPGIVASLVAREVDTEWELENIVVAGAFRRQGIGQCLLSELINHARNHNGSSIFLEVRESNESARALYGALGFEVVGSRKSYYSNPREDAILYRRLL